jgi:phosphate transport system permease protein
MVTLNSPTLGRQASRYLGDRLLGSFGFLAMLLGLATLAALLYDVAHDGVARLSWQFITSIPSRRPEEAGILTALVGSIYVILLTVVFAVPLGIGAAIHLEEYGRHGRISRLIEVNIANLAGVPSIIYGLLGLGFFVRVMGMGNSVLAGSSTLALLVLPVVIISTRGRSAKPRRSSP